MLCPPTLRPATGPYYCPGPTIAQAIPLPKKLPIDDLLLSTYWAEVVGEDKPLIGCGLCKGGDHIPLQGIMDTGADVTVILSTEWPSEWELQPIASKVPGIGGTQFAQQS